MKKDKVTLKEGSYSDDFLEFWKAYPQRQSDSKFLAWKAYERLTKKGVVTPEDLLKAVEIYKTFKEVKQGYNKLTATWLNQRCFETILENKEKYSTTSFLDSLRG